MPVAIFDDDFQKARVAATFTDLLRGIAQAIAEERERCALIAEAIDSGRGNEKEIAKAIRLGTGASR